jgi:catechol 2,3-dioxygenase-like lactoylglutathione lyase family enzyme
MAELEVGGLRHASSITKDAAKIVGFYTGVLRMRLVYKCVNFDDSAKYILAYAGGANSKGRKEGSTQEDFAAVRHFGGRVAEKAGLLVGGRAHV